MRLATLLTLPLLGALMALPAQAPAQVSITARLGPVLSIKAYSAERHGDWHTSYKKWTPVTRYEVNGSYYSKNVSGSRPVAMYRYKSETFLPPHEKAFNGYDKRYNYKHAPNEEDHGRVHSGS